MPPVPARRSGPPIGLGTPYHMAGRQRGAADSWGLPLQYHNGRKLNPLGIDTMARAQAQYITNLAAPSLLSVALGQVGAADPFGQGVRSALPAAPQPLPQMSLSEFWSMQ